MSHTPLRYSSYPSFQSEPCLLQTEGLTKAFGGNVVLDGVDLEVRRGEVIFLRGENGSGKTTLLNILTGNLEPDAGTIYYCTDATPRSYCFPRRWWQDVNAFDRFLPEFVARKGVGRTWQDIRLFGSQSLRDNIAVAKPGHPGESPIHALLSPGRSSHREAEISREAEHMLSRLGLAGREMSSADKISLGQSKRVAIARAVAAGAEILFLDEPLAGLDQQGIADVLSLLESLVYESTLALVIVEHLSYQTYLQDLITTNWLLAQGKLSITGPTPRVSSSEAPVAQQPSWFRVLAGANAKIFHEHLPRGAALTRIRKPGSSQLSSRPLLEVSGLVVKRGSRTVLGAENHGRPIGFNLTLYRDEVAILHAPNGWGKSTLFAAITGLVRFDRGEIRLDGDSLTDLPVSHRIKLGLRALSSDRNTFPSLRVTEAFKLCGRPTDLFSFGGLYSRVCSSLSGGERQRIAWEVMIESAPSRKVSILDEPFSALDSKNAKALAERLDSNQSDAVLILTPLPPFLGPMEIRSK